MTEFRLNLEGIYFRNCRYEDIPMVMYINRAVLPENYSRGLFLALWRFFKDVMFVAVDEKRQAPVGYIINKIETAKSFFDGDRVVKKGHVFSVGVLKQYRRRGIGASLLALGVISMIEKRGVEEIFLEVRVSNEPAIALYKKFGMKEVAEIPGYYADGESAYVMAARAEEMEPIARKLFETIRREGKLR